MPAYATVTDIPDEVGLAIVAVPADALTATIEQCIAKRVRGAVVVTSLDGVDGRRRTGDRGQRPAQRAAHRRSGKHGHRIAATRRRAAGCARRRRTFPPATSPSRCSPARSAAALLQMAGSLQLPMSWFVSLGDKSDVSGNDLLQFWEDDEATSVIAIYSESLGNPR